MDQFLQINIGQILQVVGVLIPAGIWIGSLKSKIAEHAGRLGQIETKLDTVTSLMTALARQEERLIAMDQRMLAQGQRIDSQATIINGRLEAINEIVRGHTAQLNNMPREIGGRRSAGG